MDAEIRFFMTPEDEEEFLSFAKMYIDEITSTNSSKQYFILGDCQLIYTPTLSEGTTLYTGCLEVRTDNVDPSCEGLQRAHLCYKKLRNWIKKKYWSRLAYINKTKKDKLMPSRIHWLAPNAKKWKEQDPENHLLKLSKTSWMVFNIGF